MLLAFEVGGLQEAVELVNQRCVRCCRWLSADGEAPCTWKRRVLVRFGREPNPSLQESEITNPESGCEVFAMDRLSVLGQTTQPSSVIKQPVAEATLAEERELDPNEPLILQEIVIHELSMDGMCSVH